MWNKAGESGINKGLDFKRKSGFRNYLFQLFVEL